MTTITRLLLLIIAALCLSTTAQGQSWLTNGLVAYYPFNGNGNDASGHGHTLINNGGTYGMDYLGSSSCAAHFDAGAAIPPEGDFGNGFGGQWMSFSDYKPINNYSEVTISMWLKPGAFLPDAYGNASASQILCQEYVVQMRIGYRPATIATVLGNGNDWFETQLSITNGTFGFSENGPWIHYVYCANAAGQKIYANGALALSSTNGIVIIGTNSSTLGLGAYYNGSIDNFRIYNRALSSSEVAQLYSMEAGLLNMHKAVYLDSAMLILGTNYQLQVSSDLLNWTNQGPPFTATGSYWRPTNYWDVENWGQLYFRLKPQ